MWCFLVHHVQINFILRGLVYFLFKVAMITIHRGQHAAFCYLVLQVTAVFVRLPDLFFQLFAALVLIGQLLRQQLTALSGFTQVLECGGGFHLHSLGDILSHESIRINKEAVCDFTWVGFSDRTRTFTTGSLPFSRSNSSCSSFTLSSRFLSSSPLLHSLCSLCLSRCDSCSERCCKDSSSWCILLRRFSFSCTDKSQITCLRLPCLVSDVPTPSRAPRLYEHGAGLRGDGGQLLQEALGDAQVLFQALVLCWQTQNSLLWVCCPLKEQNTTFSINNGR